jgi:4-amino-4-deoxy-L-arabinose transferase-like glycosyltransferase
LLPWTGFALIALKNAIKSALYRRSDERAFSENVFLLSWILGIFGFFSCSGSKLIPYILPILPPIAFLTAKMIAVEKTNDDIKFGSAMTIFLYLPAIVGFLLVKHKIALVLDDPDVMTLLSFFMLLAIIFAILSACCFWNKIIFSNILPPMIFLAMNMLWVVNKAVPYYQDVKRPSTKYMAEAIALNKTNDDLVFCYKRYHQDFPVYLNSTVGVVDFIGYLIFGKNYDKKKQSFLTEDQFWTLWNTSTKRIFLLLSRNHYRTVFAQKSQDHKILEFDKNFVVIMNRPKEKQ